MWNYVKERKHVKASISTSKTLLEMAFFLSKKTQQNQQIKDPYKRKDWEVINGGKKAKG